MRIGSGRRQTEGNSDASKRQRHADPLHQMEVVALYEPARPERHEERRGIEEQHGARCCRIQQAAIDQQEFQGE